MAAGAARRDQVEARVLLVRRSAGASATKSRPRKLGELAFAASVRGGQPSSPGPFNLWILRVAVDAVAGCQPPGPAPGKLAKVSCVSVSGGGIVLGVYSWVKRRVCAHGGGGVLRVE